MKRPFLISFVFLILAGLTCTAQQQSTVAKQKPTLFPIYLEEDFKDGRHNASRGWGYINNLGQVIIPQRFTAAGHFSEGLAPARVTLTRQGTIADLGTSSTRDDSKGKWGFINEAGAIVGSFQYDEASTFSYGRARIKLGGKFGFADRSGSVVITPRFDDAGRFAEGLAQVRINDKYGYIDLNGEVVIQQRFDWAGSFSKNLAPVRIGSLYGYIDRTGQIVIQPQFNEAGSFSEGLAKVKVNTKWGYIDKLGKLVIEARFDEAGNFSDGLGCIKLDTGWGFIDAKGAPIIAAEFDDAQGFSEGLASVKIADRWGYIDKEGKVSIYPSYLSAKPFFKGIGIVTKMEYETGYSDRTGEASLFAYETWSYIDPQGTVLAKQYRHPENLGASGSGPDFDYYTIDIYLNSRPTGAIVYLVPLYDWENDSDMINDDRKLSPYRVSQGNTDVRTFQPEKVFKGVFVLSGQRIAINIDVNMWSNRKFQVDFK